MIKTRLKGLSQLLLFPIVFLIIGFLIIGLVLILIPIWVTDGSINEWFEPIIDEFRNIKEILKKIFKRICKGQEQ